MKIFLKKQGINEDLVVNFLKVAYDAVIQGNSNSNKEFERDREQYSYRCGKSVWRISNIKKLFKQNFLSSELYKKVLHLRSYGADYYMLDGKVLFCFKKMTQRSRVQGANSARFKDSMAGNLSKYSISMLRVLSDMGILKPLPIYYIGYVLDYKEALTDVRLAHYKDNKIDYLISLKDFFNDDDLFNIMSGSGNDIPVTPSKSIEVKIKKAN